MTIKVTDFKRWRLKRILAFFCCISLSFFLIFVCKNDTLGTFFFILGMIVYSIVVNFRFISENSLVFEVLPEEDEIVIKGPKTETCFKKGSIVRIESKEIRYGGRWLDVIGKQLILYTATKKYFFGFEICDDKELLDGKHDVADKSTQYYQLKKILENYM